MPRSDRRQFHRHSDTGCAFRSADAAQIFRVYHHCRIDDGIGATTAIFSVVEATLLRPLPYPQPEQLVSIQDDFPGVGARDVGLSEPEWQDLQRISSWTYFGVGSRRSNENGFRGSCAA